MAQWGCGSGKVSNMPVYSRNLHQPRSQGGQFLLLPHRRFANTIDPVIATLAYQIIQLFPETKQLIVHSIESHPLIFEQTFETQLEVLIVAPIRQLHISETLLLIIDGVDECSGYKIQTNLIHSFSKLLQNRDLPLTVLFGSRRETQIQMAFNAREIDSILKQIPLDNNYHATGGHPAFSR